MKIDVVIPLDNRSVWNNNELRFALRSLCKYLPDHGSVIIIGTKPLFLQNIIHIPYRDRSEYPSINIYRKTMEASMHPLISDNFLMMHDDHYLLPGYDPTKYYYNHDVEEELRTADHILYKRVIRNTLNALINHSPDVTMWNYDVHTPIMYNKKQFLHVANQFQWLVDWGLMNKSIYCNYFNLPGTQILDGKIRLNKEYEYLVEFIKDKVVLSSGDHINPAFKRLLNELYPDKCKYEL